MLDEVLNFVDEFLHAGKGPASDRPLRDKVEPDFDLIEP